MKVSILGARGFDLLEDNLAETLCTMGHDSVIFDAYQDVPLISRLGRKVLHTLMRANYSFSVYVWKQSVKQVLSQKPDIVIVTDREVPPEAIICLKNGLKHSPVIHLNPDAVTNLFRQYIFMSPYDAFFTKEPFLADIMRRLYGLNAFYLPECFNPRIHKKPDQQKLELEAAADIDIVVIASLNPYRVKFLECLMRYLPSNVKIRIYGNPKALPWVGPRLRHFHANRPLFGAEKAEAFYSARIALNTMHPSEFHGVNCRFFEALGSGAFLLSENRLTIPDLAQPGIEVVTFNDVQEAASKVKYFLQHETERFSIAEAGYQRAMNDHTYENRVEAIFTILGGGKA
jgi:spore maturation protein CgeB